MAAIAADRDLLFGLLALQNGLIDQVQLVAAFQAWTRDRARPLAGHLAARGDLDPDQRAGVEAMVGLHLKKHGGDATRSLAAIPAGPSTRESLAALGDPAIEQTLTRLGPGSDADPDRTASYAVGTATADGQRFRVLRPHARGGLGAVFVALDAELNREVALKQILDRHADDPASRARFLLEAEITGGLEHPGIVPIYGLGTYADGRPFYAMRLIKGDSLKEVANRFHADGSSEADPGRRSLALRQLLRRFTDVCNAIEYAHSRGVLHRDIKPGNIIAGKHGETLVVDWGLAKATGRPDPGADPGERTLVPSSASGSAETLPGSALGTPAYMSPEQAEGDLEHLGPRSDIYSLGATLYYVLTGRPPVEGDVHEAIRAVQRGEFRHPRQLDATIDRALEAVCLKAMAHRPADRYASPKALSEDVERWMADEPVSAWREPFSRRARRWARRNRTKVATAAAAMLAGVIGLSAILVVQTQAKAEVAKGLARETDAKDALAAANAELSRSKAAVQARYDLAVDAIKTFHTGVSEDFLLKQDRFKELRDRLLQSAADFYGKLGALLGKETDITSRRALADSNYELADLTWNVGRSESALAAHRAVLAAREALASEPGAGAAEKADVGRSLTAVAGLLASTGKTEEALAAYRESESLLAGPARSDPPARAALAACRTRLGFLLSRTGKIAEALAAYTLARSDQEALAAVPGSSNGARRDLADTVGRIGILLQETGRISEAEAEKRAALAIRQKLVDDHPAVTGFRSDLAISQLNLGVLLWQTGRASGAESEYRAALAIYRELADHHPAVTGFRADLAQSHNNLGILLRQTGKPSEAEGAYRAALALYRKPSDDHPSAIDFRRGLADSHGHLGVLLRQTGRASGAESEYRAALAIYRELADDHPTVIESRYRLAISQYNLGNLLRQTGRASGAESEYRAALAIFRKLADDDPKVPGYRNAAAKADNNLSTVLSRSGRAAEARHHVERAVAALEALVKAHPQAMDYREGLAESYLNRGLVRGALGDPVGAAADVRRALALIDGLALRTGEFRFLSACAHAALAGLADRAGSGVSAAEASSEADTAMALLRKAIELGFSSADAYRTEDALDPLRSRDDFRLLMLDLAMPADPFAQAR